MRKRNGGCGLKKSFVALVGGLCAFVAAGFPLNPSFTPEAVKGYKAKADAGDAEAQYLYSYALVNGTGVKRNKAQAFAYAKKAVDQGYGRALRLVGVGYEKGWCVDVDPSKAADCFSRFADWARKVADEGDAWAQDALGKCYEDGNGVLKDTVEAEKWYRRAAERGMPVAQYHEGVCQAKGITGTKNPGEAVKWFRKAAEQGDNPSRWALCWCYRKGIGVAKDKVESEKWLRTSWCLGGDPLKRILFYGRNLIVLVAVTLLLSIGIWIYGEMDASMGLVVALRSRQSALYRIYKLFETSLMILLAVVLSGFAVRVKGTLDQHCRNDGVPFGIAGFLDDLGLSIVALLWGMVAVYCGTALFLGLKNRRKKETTETARLTFRQYVKVIALESFGNFVLPVLLWVVSLVWIERYAYAVVGFVTLLALTFSCWPTRKKYEKLLDGVPAKRTGNEYVVIYREPGEPLPKKTTLVCADDTQLRVECAEKGWEILYVRCVGDTRALARFNRWCASPIRCPVHFGVSTAELCLFCEVMNLLLAAGVPKEAAIEFCAREAPNAWFRKRLQIVLERLRSGDDLAHAMEDAQCVKAFPPLLRKAIRIGEANGHLDVALDRAKMALSLSEAKRHQLLRVEGNAILMLISAIAVFICSFNAASFADCAGFCGLSAVMAGSGVFILLCKRWTERNIKAKIFFTRWHRRQRERGKRQDAWMREHNWFAVLLLVVTLVWLPFGLEELGENTKWFRFPATAWVKGLWK